MLYEINALGPLLDCKHLLLRPLSPGKSAYQQALYHRLLTDENLMWGQDAAPIAKWKSAFPKESVFAKLKVDHLQGS